MLVDSHTVRLLVGAILLVAACDIAAAQTVPLPRPRPFNAAGDVLTPTLPAKPPATAVAPTAKPEAPPSACRLRLTPELAIAPSLPPIEGPGECGASDLVRLEAIVLADASRITVNPPATLRCTMAEVVASFVRADVAPLALELGATLRALQNYDSYDCRGRNRVVGARTSEHGKGNALDLRGLTLANGKYIELTDPQVAHAFRDKLRKNTCARFTTVLGPGSDGYHENHIHMDLAERRSGYRMCHWDVRDPEPAAAAPALASAGATSAVPLPPPRPKIEAKRDRKL
jgi:hypothetical protein